MVATAQSCSGSSLKAQECRHVSSKSGRSHVKIRGQVSSVIMYLPKVDAGTLKFVDRWVVLLCTCQKWTHAKICGRVIFYHHWTSITWTLYIFGVGVETDPSVTCQALFATQYRLTGAKYKLWRITMGVYSVYKRVRKSSCILGPSSVLKNFAYILTTVRLRKIPIRQT